MPAQTKVLYEFGKFRCDPREQLLLHEDKPVSLSPKSFEILVALLQNSNRLLTKEELTQQIWPDSFVEESNLTVNISALRKVLGELPGGQPYIETVPKRGYRFVAPVRAFSEGGNLSPQAQALSVDQTKQLPEVVPGALRARSLRWWAPVAGLLLVAVMVVVLVSNRSARLTDKDTVVLADVANSTGDAVFDDALRQGLSAQLGQSPFLNLLSDNRIAQTLSLMSQPKDSRLTPDLAREVCQRTASAAVLDGAITQVGTEYLLTLKATNCSSGDSLGSAEAQAADKNHVLEAMGKVASGIRNQLGESLASVQKYDAPPESVTTPSLEALKAYSLGYQNMVVKSDYAASVPLFERAISLDPNFAMAYARIGTSYFNLHETVRATESVRRAFELRAHLSERERLYIASHYELVVTGNLVAARKVFEVLAQIYPRDAPYTNLGIVYSQLGDYDQALGAFETAVKIGPTGNRYANLVNGYIQLNRLNEALDTVREAQAHKIDSPEIHVNLYWVAFLQHDAAGMEREAAKVRQDPGYEHEMLNFESDTALYGGQLVKSRLLARRAVEAAQKADEKEAAGLYVAEAAVREALVGYVDLAKQQARAALALSNGRDVEAMSAIALGMAGDFKQAKRLADELGKRFPEDTLVEFNYLPTIYGAVLVQRNNGSMAAQALEAAAPYELGGNLLTLNFILYPVYIRGAAYLAAKQGHEAAAEFQKILDHPGAVRSEPIAALAHLELGRAFALSGDRIKAKGAYQEFFTLWNDADTEIPVLRQAKAEYSKMD